MLPKSHNTLNFPGFLREAERREPQRLLLHCKTATGRRGTPLSGASASDQRPALRPALSCLLKSDAGAPPRLLREEFHPCIHQGLLNSLFLGYFDGHTSDERPGTSEKSSGLKVTKVARCTRA